MALRQEPTSTSQTSASGRARPERGAAFRTHLAVYLVRRAVPVHAQPPDQPRSISGSTGRLFFWGWALVFHAVVTYGDRRACARPGGAALARPGLAATPLGPDDRADRAASTVAPFAGDGVRRGSRTDRTAQGDRPAIATGRARTGDAIHAEAERIVAAWPRPRRRATVHRFDADAGAGRIAPRRYIDAASHGVASADEALRRIAERDLPLLEPPRRMPTIHPRRRRPAAASAIRA